jgi:hypothetical protein
MSDMYIGIKRCAEHADFGGDYGSIRSVNLTRHLTHLRTTVDCGNYGYRDAYNKNETSCQLDQLGRSCRTNKLLGDEQSDAGY